MNNLLRKVRGMKSVMTGFINRAFRFEFPVVVSKTPRFQLSITKRGFSLVELLVVIVIIGLLFMVFVPRINFASNSARETGVKSDFRSFGLAAEQLLRENAGVSKHDTLSELCAADGGINQYLDSELQFDTSGSCLQEDPWNRQYELQLVLQTGVGANDNNGALLFISGGKDGVIDGNDDYIMAISFANGVISSETSGFSSDIESAGIAGISAESAASYSLSGNTVTLKYEK